MANLKDVVAISAGYVGWLALRADGTVAGDAPAGLTEIDAISSSCGSDQRISLVLHKDGTVTGWGFDHCGAEYSAYDCALSNIVDARLEPSSLGEIELAIEQLKQARPGGLAPSTPLALAVLGSGQKRCNDKYC